MFIRTSDLHLKPYRIAPFNFQKDHSPLTDRLQQGCCKRAYREVFTVRLLMVWGLAPLLIILRRL